MQTKLESLKEAVANTLLGYLIALFSTCLILPLFGIPFEFLKFSSITACFTAISVVRNYVIRRHFNRK